jgi:hypothetical protein
MTSSTSFYFNFLDTPCLVELPADKPEAAVLFQRYQAMFPVFTGTDKVPPRFTVRIHDIGGRPQVVSPDDPVFAAMQEYFAAGYDLSDTELVARICSPEFVPDAHVRNQMLAALENSSQQGLSLQKDFLVLSDRAAGVVDAYADISSSLQEAWAFHVLNFFKIFFFAMGAVRLHGSGATVGDRALLFLANTGGGKSTMKDLFLSETPLAQPFTDDSIMAMRTPEGFCLYQDPVEFMRWCYLPEAALKEHVIPEPRQAMTAAPVIYYLYQGETTAWSTCAPEDIFRRVNEEAFFQKGFLTQRFIPQPQSSTYLQDYFANTRKLLAECRCLLACVKHHDDYDPLFSNWREDLGIQQADL